MPPELSATSLLSLTPRFSGVIAKMSARNRFSGFVQLWKNRWSSYQHVR